MGLAAHLIETYENKPTFNPSYPTPVRPPFRPFLPPQPELRSSMNPDESWMSSHGFPSSTGGPSRFTQWSEDKIAQLQTRLARKLGPEYVTQRQGPAGGGKLRSAVPESRRKADRGSYIEGWKVINLANEVFGFNGWSTSIQSLTTDYVRGLPRVPPSSSHSQLASSSICRFDREILLSSLRHQTVP